MASDSYALTVPGEERALLLPPPKHKALEPLWAGMPRLADCVQRTGVSTRAFLAALAVEANKLPATVNVRSVAVAAFNAAITGAIVGPSYGHAFLVPFKDQCQLVWGYKGLVDLAYETGFLASIHTEIVLEGEKAERWVDELGAHIRHELPPMTVARDLAWSQVRAAYCVWRATTGAGDVAIVELDELRKLKRRGHVWDSHPLAMCRKTAVIRASKSWKLAGRLGMAVSLEDHAEAGKPQPPLEPMPEDGPPPPSTDDFPGDTSVTSRGTDGERSTEAPSGDDDPFWDAHNGAPTDARTTTRLLTGMEDKGKQERD